MRPYRRVLFYLRGYLEVFTQAGALAMLVLWLFQIAAIVTDAASFDPVPVVLNLFATFSFLFFFPGQTYWTHTREGPDGRTYVIVGAEDRALD